MKDGGEWRIKVGEEEEEKKEGYLIQRHKNSPPALPPSLPPSSLPFRKGTREAPTFTSAVYYLSRPPRARLFLLPANFAPGSSLDGAGTYFGMADRQIDRVGPTDGDDSSIKM